MRVNDGESRERQWMTRDEHAGNQPVRHRETGALLQRTSCDVLPGLAPAHFGEPDKMQPVVRVE